MSGDAWQSRAGWPHMATHHTLQECICKADYLAGRSRAAYQLETPEGCRMCRKCLYLTNCKCKIIKLNVEACQKSYFCSILAALTCLHLSGLQTNRMLKGIKTLHLYHCTGFYSHLACHTLLCPDTWSILQKLILGDACKSVFYSIEKVWEESELTVITFGWWDYDIF